LKRANKKLKESGKKAAGIINSSDFTLSLYVGQIGYSSIEVYNFDNYRPKKPWIEIGRIEAYKLPVRPHYEGMAPMLENQETYEKCWLQAMFYEKYI